jgi:hypothetical protein
MVLERGMDKQRLEHTDKDFTAAMTHDCVNCIRVCSAGKDSSDDAFVPFE